MDVIICSASNCLITEIPLPSDSAEGDFPEGRHPLCQFAILTLESSVVFAANLVQTLLHGGHIYLWNVTRVQTV